MKFLIVVKFGKVEKVDESLLKEILSHCRFCRSSSLHQLPQDPKVQDLNSKISHSHHKIVNSQLKNVKSKTMSTQPTSSSQLSEACLHWEEAAVVVKAVLMETSWESWSILSLQNLVWEVKIRAEVMELIRRCSSEISLELSPASSVMPCWAKSNLIIQTVVLKLLILNKNVFSIYIKFTLSFLLRRPPEPKQVRGHQNQNRFERHWNRDGHKKYGNFRCFPKLSMRLYLHNLSQRAFISDDHKKLFASLRLVTWNLAD